MPEGLKLVISADTSEAEAALKEFASEAKDTGKGVNANLSKAFEDLKRTGVVSLGGVQDALKQLKSAISVATNPEDIKKLNQAFLFLKKEEEKLKNTGLDKHLEGVSRSSQKAATTALGFAKVIELFPPEVQHLTHSFDNLLQSFEQIHAKTGSSKEALKTLASAFAGPIGIGIGISLVVGLLQEFGAELFNSEEKTKASEAALKSFAEQLERVKGNVEDLTDALQFQNELGAINVKIQGQGDIQNLKEQSVAQAQFIVSLETQRDKIKKIGQEIADNEELSADDRIKSEEENAKSLKEINKRIIEEERRQLILYREIALQKVEDQKAAHEKSLSDNEKFITDTINQAKRTAAFLDKNTQFAVSFEIDPLDNKTEQFAKAKEFLKRAKDFVEKQTPEFKFKPRISFDVQFNQAIQQGQGRENIFRSVKDNATKTFDQARQAFEDNIKDLAAKNPILLEFITIQKQKDALIKNQGELASAVGLKIDGITGAESSLTAIQKEAAVAANTINGLLTPAFQGLFSAIKAGDDPLKAFFQGLGNAIEQLIQKLIAAAVQALILSAIFPGGIGGVKGFGGFFKSVLGFAQGGIVTGPTLALIGEGVGTSRSNPEVVAPLDQLKSMLGGMAGNGSQGGVMTSRIRGRDIILSSNRTSRQQRRTGG